MVRQLYRDGGATMALGNPPILFQEGRAVGGSTVINGGMSWRTPERDPRALAQRGRPRRHRRSRLEPYFERVEQRIHVAPMDADAIGNDNQLLKKGADAKGWKIIGNLRNQAHCVGIEPLRVRLPDRREAERARQLHPARAALRRARLRRRSASTASRCTASARPA